MLVVSGTAGIFRHACIEELRYEYDSSVVCTSKYVGCSRPTDLRLPAARGRRRGSQAFLCRTSVVYPGLGSIRVVRSVVPPPASSRFLPPPPPNRSLRLNLKKQIPTGDDDITPRQEPNAAVGLRHNTPFSYRH